MSGDVFLGKHGMRLIGSESEEQQGEPATGSGTVINGELVIGPGSRLVASGMVEIGPDSTITIEDGGMLEIDDPPAERRLMTRADAERLLAEVQSEPLSRADRAAIRAMLDIGPPEPLSPAAVDHLLGWYTAADKVAEVQRRLALAEVQGMLKPITLGIDIPAIFDPMVSVRGQLDQLARSAAELVQQMAAPVAISAAESLRQMMADSTLTAAIGEQRAQLEREMASFASVTAGSGALLSQLAYSPLATGSSRARTYEETRRYGGAWAEPPAEQGRLEAVRVQPADWRAVLTMAIKGGHASPKEVAAWLHDIAQQHGPGQKPAEWAEIETVAALYRERGHRYENQEAFVAFLARKGIAISVPTLQRRLAEYERVTGERVRPGRGSRRRGSL